MNKPQIFELEVSRFNPSGLNITTEIVLPATPYELADVLEQVQVTDEHIYSLEFLSCELDYLTRIIGEDVNLYELNNLASRLSSLNQWELDCFEGMVMMDTVKKQYAPIKIDRLINMTYSTESCQIVHEAHDDASLGKFYADNGFVTELETLSERIFPWLDYAKIGKEMRESEGGVFTPHGYVVQYGEIIQKYQGGEAVPTQTPDYAMLLRVTKGYFNESEYDNAPVALLKLPADDSTLYQAVEAVGAGSPEECSFIAEDCMVPSLMEKISDALYRTEGDCYGLVNELAKQLTYMNDKGSILTYKAMMHGTVEDITLEDALDLSHQTDNFSVIREAVTPVEYARYMLSKYCIECEQDLLASADLYHYGTKLMEEKGVSMTEYGVLWSLTGQTVEQCLQQPDQHQGMEMK